jgi:hypothetical protein
MLKIDVIMNSSVEEVLAFKCCHLMDQNLEIHVTNLAREPVRVKNSCELVRGEERLRIDYLYPPGGYTIQPGDTVAFYCTLSDEVFERYESIVFRDDRGREHTAALRPAGVNAPPPG